MDEELREAFLVWVKKTQWSAAVLVHGSVKRICPLCGQFENMGHTWNCVTKVLIDTLMRQ